MRSHCGTTLGFDGGYYMTCSKNFGRLLQAGCLGLIGMLTVVSCGGSSTSPKLDTGVPGNGGSGGGGLDGGPPGLSVTVTPPSADFGPVVKGGTSSAPTVFTVTNKGAATSLSPTATSPFAVVSTTCGTLAVGGTCAIGVSFSPKDTGPFNGVLTVATGVSVTLTGTGLAPGAFTVTDKVDLGPVLVGATVAGAVTVSAISAVSGLSCLISGADLTAVATQVCPATLAAGASCTVGFTFKAATTGAKSESVVCSSAGIVLTTPVTATVVTPASLAFQAPATVSAGTPVGTSSSTISFTLVNSGGSSTGALTVTPGNDTTQFAVDNQCALPLAAASTCKINVVFRPTTAGAKTLTLTVTDAAAPLTSVVATANGVATPQGSLTLTGTGSFGSVAVGATSAPAVFTVSNPAGQTDIAGLKITVTDPQFVVTADGCSGLTLATGKSCTVSVVFTPSAAGSVGANLSASAPGTPAASLPINGLGVAPPAGAALTLSPPTLDFGTTGVNVSVGPKTFVVTNTGGSATGVLSVVKKDSTSSTGGGTQFTYTTTCSAALAPADTCNIVVTFAPTIGGNASATFSVSDGTTTSLEYTVVGTALVRPTLGLSCPGTTITGSFDGTRPGIPTPSGVGTVIGTTATSNIVCTVSNGSTSSQATGAIKVVPTGDFAVGTNNCTGTLASLDVGESCTFLLTFTPTTKGERDGIVTVTTANGGAANQNLYGTGVSVVQIDEIATVSTVTGVQTQPYDFGQVSVGATSIATTNVTLNVYVRGKVGNLAISGTDFKFLVTDTAPADFIQVAQGGTPAIPDCAKITTTAPTPSNTAFCRMVVAFNPQAKGLKTVTFTASGADGTSDTATAQGTGTGPITIAPTPLTFNAVEVGSSSSTPLTLTVRNNAPSAGSNATITITGPNAGDFSIVNDPISNLPLGASAQVLVPILVTVPAGAAVGSLSATVTVSATIAGVTETATGSLVGSAVTGAGITATLNGTFASTVVTGISAPVTVTVKNTGALTTGAITAQVGGGGDFTITPPAGQAQGTCVLGTTTLAPGASCNLSVWFEPNAGLGVSARAGTLTVGSVTGGMQVLSLTGQATGLLTITPSTQDVGLTVLGDPAPAVKTFTITNNGASQVAPGVSLFNDVGQTGKNEFTIANNHCPALLGAAGSSSPLPSCTVDVNLMVASSGLPGPRAATLKVTGTVGTTNAGTATAVVTGTAANPAKLQLTPVDSTIVAASASTVDRDFGSVQLNTTSAAQTFVVTNVGGFDSSALSFAFYDNGTSLATVHAKTADFDTAGSTCVGDGAIVHAGQSCTIKVVFHPTTCTQPYTTACPGNTGPGTVGVQLVITAAHGTEMMTGAHLVGPKLYGTPIATNIPYVVGATSGLAPYDYVSGKAATAKTALLAIHNPSAADFKVPATFTFPDAANVVVGNVVTGALEFTVGTIPAGTTKPCTPGTTVLAANANDYCVFAVAWTPAATTGTREVTVTFTDATTPAPTTPATAVINLLGRVLAGASLLAVPYPIAQTATPVAFGNSVVGADSLVKTITIMNVGELATTDDLTVVDLNSQVKVGSDTTCQGPGSALAANATCTLALSVHPADTTDHVTTPVAAKSITLVSDPTDLMMGDDVTVSWQGIAAAKLTASPTKLAFDTGGHGVSSTYPGTGVLATTDYMDVTITNATGAPATGPLSISTSAADFYIEPYNPSATPALTHSTCLAASLSFTGLDGGTGCVIRVFFSPVTLATPAKTGNLVVTPASAPVLSIQLSGTAIPALTVSKGATTATDNSTPTTTFTGTTSSANATLAYGVTSINGPYTNQLFTFTKASGSPATGLLSTGIAGGTGATPDQFRIIADTCTGVSLSDATPNCTVTVRFAPTSAGANKNAVLTVLDPSSGTPADSISVALTGNANP
jgi:hypothetical protein